MKIVIFEEKILGSDDADWERLKDLDYISSVKKYIDVTDDELIEKAQDADIIICNSGNFQNGELSRLPNLKYLGLMTTGYNQVNLKQAKENNITVTNVPMYGTMSVAQHVMGLLLEICSKVGFYNEAVKKTFWQDENQFMFRIGKQFELDGKTIGILGLGNIGFALAKMARGIYSGKVYAAGLDTLNQEPPKSNNPLLGLPQCIITPHMAWSTKEARGRIVEIAIDNIISYIGGTTINEVK